MNNHSIATPRPLCAEERAAVAFFEEHHGGAVERINELETLYHETICDAGRYWMHCEFTRESLKSIQKEIDETVEYWVERIRDWASD